MEARKKITRVFNLCLLLYYLVGLFTISLAEPEDDRKTTLDIIFDWSPATSTVGLLLIAFVLIYFGAILVKEFWNRFITDVFKVREITFDESLALVLMISIITAG
jgi:hypothetical protein